jgi:hypothetical protein
LTLSPVAVDLLLKLDAGDAGGGVLLVVSQELAEVLAELEARPALIDRHAAHGGPPPGWHVLLLPRGRRLAADLRARDLSITRTGTQP